MIDAVSSRFPFLSSQDSDFSLSNAQIAQAPSSSESGPTFVGDGRTIPVMERGMVGNEVYNIQTRLQDLRYYSGPHDGIFGEETENAVEAFQRRAGLVVDGIVGEATFKAVSEAHKNWRDLRRDAVTI